MPMPTFSSAFGVARTVGSVWSAYADRALAMALATKCPQCGALFRVVADQLKLRGGLVRCGQCRAVFDAIGSLTYVDDTAWRRRAPSPRSRNHCQAPPPSSRSARASRPEPQHLRAERRARARRPPTPARASRHARSGHDAAHRTDGTGNAGQRIVATLGAFADCIARPSMKPTTRREAPFEIKRERAFRRRPRQFSAFRHLIAPGGRERVDASSIVDGIEVIELAALPGETEARPAQPTRVPSPKKNPSSFAPINREHGAASRSSSAAVPCCCRVDRPAARRHFPRRAIGTDSAGAQCAGATMRSVRMRGGMADSGRSTGGDRQRAADDPRHRRARADRGDTEPRRVQAGAAAVEVTLTDRSTANCAQGIHARRLPCRRWRTVVAH